MTRAITRMFLARRRAEISQAELARQIGVTQPRISAWETRTVPIPEARREAIAKLLGLEADELTLDA